MVGQIGAGRKTVTLVGKARKTVKERQGVLKPRLTQLVDNGGGDGGIASQFAIGDVLHNRIAASKHETRASRRMANRDALFIDLTLTALPEMLSKVMERAGKQQPEARGAALEAKLAAGTKSKSRNTILTKQIEQDREVSPLCQDLDYWIDDIKDLKDEQASAKRSDAPVRVVEEQYWSSFWEMYRADTTKVAPETKKSPRSKPGYGAKLGTVKLPPVPSRGSASSSMTPLVPVPPPPIPTKERSWSVLKIEALKSGKPQKKIAETMEQKCERILSEFVGAAALAESPSQSRSPSPRTPKISFSAQLRDSASSLASFSEPHSSLATPSNAGIKNLLGYRFKGFDDYKKNGPNSKTGELPQVNARANKARNPLATSFHRPWSSDVRNEPETGARFVKNSEEIHITPVRRFAMICRSICVHPKPQSMWFLIQGAEIGELALRDAGYADEDLLAITASLHYTEEVEVVDVGENNRLTDASVGPLLRLLANAHSESLREIYLDRLRRVGSKSIRLLHKLLNKSFPCIEKLNLSGINIAFHEYQELTKVINRHPTIREVFLAETGLGLYNKTQTTECISRLLGNPRMEVLDLSWNFLDTSCLDAVGQGIHSHRRLSSLSLANTCPTVDPTLDGSPILIFLEHLAFDESLTVLDISNNALNADAALVLESAARKHPLLKEVNISSNPIGLTGIRSMLRLVASQDSSLQTFGMEDCIKGGGGSSKAAAMDGDPSGRYTWTMEFPVHRALVRLLLTKWTEGESHIPLDKLFRSSTLDGKGIQCSAIIRKVEDIWEVPMKGELSMEVCIGDMLFTVQEPSASAFLDRTLRQTRLPLNIVSRSLAVLGLGSEQHTEDERNQFLIALSYDFILGPEHIDALCNSNSTKHGYGPRSVLSRLLPCLRGNAQMRQAITLTRSLDDLMLVHKEAERLLNMNIENPTGFYALHLATPCESTVARHLLLVNRWEALTWKDRCGERDVSEHGNFKCLRNVRYANRKFHYEADDWRLPGESLLEFDFVSLRRPPAHAQPMPDEQWSKYLDHIKRTMAGLFAGDSEEQSPEWHGEYLARTNTHEQSQFQGDKLSDIDVLSCIRATSSVLWIKSRQLRELLCFLSVATTRQEAFICLFFRTLDAPLNEKLIRSKFSHEEWIQLKQRMGYITLFPYFQPENSKVTLNLSIYEQRRCVHLLKVLDMAEPGDSMKEPLLDKNGTGEFEKFFAGVPATWEKFDQIPTTGFFKVTFVSSVDNVRLRSRRRLACEWGGWQLAEDSKTILRDLEWWALLDEQPPEVNEFIEFLTARYEDLAKPFSVIDASGDGNVTLSEFLVGVQKLGYLPPQQGKGDSENSKGISKSANFGKQKTEPKAQVEFGKQKTEPKSAAEVLTKGPDLSKSDTGKSKGWLTMSSQVKAMNMLAKLKGGPKRDSTRGMVVNEEAAYKRNEASYKEIFRYLNVDGHGEISLKEWRMMEAYMRELKLSMCEFVDYLLLGFGDLETAWEAADADGSGALDLEEFLAVGEKWVVVGPVRPIFFYLDKDNSGEIDRDEWNEMVKLVGKHKLNSIEEEERSSDSDSESEKSVDLS